MLGSELLASTSASYPALAEEGARADVLHRLVGDWQLLADLSFADLVLYVPDRELDEVRRRRADAADHRSDRLPGRPGRHLVAGRRPAAARGGDRARAGSSARAIRSGSSGTPVREEALPVRVGGRIVAVVARATNLAAARTPSQLEIAYLRSANDLAQMLAEGRWPYPGEPAPEGGPRVGDGLIRLDAAGIVTFASPNALSAYRRLGHVGDLAGSSLAEITGTLGGRNAPPSRRASRGDRPGPDARHRRRPGRATSSSSSARLPLRPGGEHIGAHRAGPRRHRAASSGARVDHQGRDDPRDPSPGEEQPADRGGTAAAAGAADGGRRRRATRSRSRSAGSRRSRSCTRRCPGRSTRR